MSEIDRLKELFDNINSDKELINYIFSDFDRVLKIADRVDAPAVETLTSLYASLFRFQKSLEKEMTSLSEFEVVFIITSIFKRFTEENFMIVRIKK